MFLSKRQQRERRQSKFTVGLILSCAALVALFWNEGRAVKTAQSLDEGKEVVVAIESPEINAANESKLLHLVGQTATSDDAITDPDLGLSFASIVKLSRDIMLYQWQGKREGKGEDASYTYKKVWSERWIDSEDYGADYKNPKPLIEEKTLTANVVTVGDFKLTDSLLKKISTSDFISLDQTRLSELPDQFRDKTIIYDNGLYIAPAGTADPTSPQIGDIQVSFKAAKPALVSVIAEQQDDHLAPYEAASGYSVAMLKEGRFTADEMFSEAIAANTAMTWALRMSGFAMLFLALRMMFDNLARYIGQIPLLAGIFRGAANLVSTLLAGVLTLLTIALGWLFYRPLVALVLVAAAVVLFVALKRMRTPSKQIGY